MGTLQQLINHHMESSDELAALSGGSRTFTFKEYCERVNQLSHYLLEAGVQKGDHVAILCKNNHHFPVILLASLKIGATAVPLSWQLTSYELEGILNKSQPKAVFYDREFADVLLPLRRQLERCILIEAGVGMDTTGQFESLLKDRPSEVETEQVTEHDLALMLFTSGTTGNPKGCMVNHGSLAAYLTEVNVKGKRLKGTRFLASHPLYHMSSLNHVFQGAFEGVGLYFLSDPEPAEILQEIEAKGIHMMMAFPSVYTYMLEEMKKREYNLSSILSLISGGTKVPVRLIKEYHERGIQMVQGYGSTEAWTISVWRPDMGWDKVNSAGKPIPHVSVKIVHPETREELPAGEVGEVAVKSPYVFEGYYQNPQATQKVLKDGWFYMGDSGRLDEDGFLYITGRYKDVIVYGGDNIYPDQVEEVIEQVPGVVETAVIGVPDEMYGEVPRAYVVKNENSPLSERDIIEFCKGRLAEYKIPDIVFAESLPKNRLGKIVKKDLRELAAKGQ
ncbi:MULTISPECIES: class I adenylate-forming enzyme family protein [Bacillus]|uniref:class I adenylate-forming enzyme family protein n=1 Tax=Bacillus TaxID=1386 RepID=UPI0006171F51|nr:MULTISPECIES: class I adenylate-forming enzyme family protein [Bacillus]KKB75475.1 acyl--CoA ligase [Bacillus sp. TH008]MDU0071162.1 class I adenylate-forming enzyme family protein [Bacillus sp. IG6]MED8019030.1 class I adenylate-forming enzyme family protein [Bacillus glycinifermentans]WKB77654.1 class I adenylate-forming enzyme family protein [Bacillus glycinifermentans]SCA84125.1 AMP-dependent synthetase/ligase [Bacillus glycinifermentans]